MDDNGTYNYLFFRQYQLRCEHLWQQDLLYKMLTAEKWDIYAFMFENCGLEVYELASKVYITQDIHKEVGAPARWKLRSERS